MKSYVINYVNIVLIYCKFQYRTANLKQKNNKDLISELYTIRKLKTYLSSSYFTFKIQKDFILMFIFTLLSFNFYIILNLSFCYLE